MARNLIQLAVDKKNRRIQEKSSKPSTDGERTIIIEKIKRRRLQILVHSCIYYEFDTNIIPDTLYDKFSKELAELQKNYPAYSKEVTDWYEEFKDWDGSTGMHLPHRNPWVMDKAQYLLNLRR